MDPILEVVIAWPDVDDRDPTSEVIPEEVRELEVGNIVEPNVPDELEEWKGTVSTEVVEIFANGPVVP